MIFAKMVQLGTDPFCIIFAKVIQKGSVPNCTIFDFCGVASYKKVK